jgi:hypothetical protein
MKRIRKSLNVDVADVVDVVDVVVCVTTVPRHEL